jgi:UDPglucose--hexose-1-phosphate uridylyltransferase
VTAGAAPEVRIDQLTGLRTLLAPARADRPEGFAPARHEPKGADGCPFCEGREDRTPPEVWAEREQGEADGPGWTARAVPNLYPALAGPPGSPAGGPAGASAGAFTAAADPLVASRRAGEADLFSSRPARGAHEVIVNAPEHVTAMAELEQGRFAGAIAAWRERMRAHADAACVQLVLNEGGGAGASLEHTHAQLYALPFVPVAVARERERDSAYRERTGGGDLLGDIVVEEVRRRERLVAIDEEAALICPWASRSPFELRVVPRRQAARFEAEETGGAMIRAALLALAARFGAPPELNLWIRTAPPGSEGFRWHVDIVPRLTVRAGFELGTGIDINIYPPERAAADLREALPS